MHYSPFSILHLSRHIRRPNPSKRIGRAFDHQSARQNILSESFIGGNEIFFFILTQDIEGADQPDSFTFLQRQIESAEAKESFVIGIRKRGIHAFLVNFNAQNFQRWIQASKTRRRFKRGARVEAIAEINEQGIRKPATSPRKKRRLIKQDKVIDAPESIRSSLAARWLTLRFLWNSTRMKSRFHRL